MCRILILGGYGLTGKWLTRYLLQHSRAEIVVAGRHLEQAERFAAAVNAEFQGQRVSACRADAASRRDLQHALRGVDFLLVAAPTTRQAETVISAALEAGVDYLDVQLDARKLALLQARAPEIELSGRCFITEAGSHPGLPAVMVRYAATRLDRLDAATLATYMSFGREVPYTTAVDELMETFRNYRGQVFRRGGWTSPRTFDVREVDFGGEIGARKCYSLFLEELRDLPRILPGLQELGFYVAGTHWVVDWLITAIVLAGLRVSPRRGIRPLGRLLWWGMQSFSRSPYLFSFKVEAVGEVAGEATAVDVTLSHADGYVLTAIPVVACLLQYLDGSARRPGLWLMGHLVDPVRLFDDMRAMGVGVAMDITRQGRSI